MAYRCQGCRLYQRGSPHRRVGLGGICSEDCAQLARRRAAEDGVPPATHAAVLERDNGCRFCGTRSGLHVHHIAYRSQGVDHSDTNLITLCREHHDLVHTSKGRWQPVCMTYITEVLAGRARYLPELDREINGRPAASP